MPAWMLTDVNECELLDQSRADNLPEIPVWFVEGQYVFMGCGVRP